jgi:hypothetical protein
VTRDITFLLSLNSFGKTLMAVGLVLMVLGVVILIREFWEG